MVPGGSFNLHLQRSIASPVDKRRTAVERGIKIGGPMPSRNGK